MEKHRHAYLFNMGTLCVCAKTRPARLARITRMRRDRGPKASPLTTGTMVKAGSPEAGR